MQVFLGTVLALLVAQTTPSAPTWSAWSAWSLNFDPATAGATNVRWTVSLSAPYCGGYRVGDGVHIAPEAPLSLPATVPAEDVVFAGNAAVVSMDASGALVVSQSPRVVRSQVCMQGERA